MLTTQGCFCDIERYALLDMLIFETFGNFIWPVYMLKTLTRVLKQKRIKISSIRKKLHYISFQFNYALHGLFCSYVPNDIFFIH